MVHLLTFVVSVKSMPLGFIGSLYSGRACRPDGLVACDLASILGDGYGVGPIIGGALPHHQHGRRSSCIPIFPRLLEAISEMRRRTRPLIEDMKFGVANNGKWYEQGLRFIGSTLWAGPAP